MPNVQKVLHSSVESHQKNHSNLIFRKSFALSRKYPTNFFKEAGRNDRAYTSPHPKLSTRHHLRVTSHLVTRSREAQRRTALVSAPLILKHKTCTIPPQNPMPPTFIKMEEFVFCEQSERLSVPPAWRAGYIPSRFKNKIDKHDIR